MANSIQISIPTPCHESWENMTPADKGRFCSSCQKTVIDFTHLSDREIATSFKNDKNLCGKFLNSQLQRDLIIPKEKKSLWVVASTAVVSFLTLGNHTVTAQAPVNTEQTENKTDDIKAVDTAPATESIITGIVLDETGLPLPGINIIVKGTKGSIQTDLDGKFSISASPNDTLIVSFIGFEQVTTTVGCKDENFTIKLKEDLTILDDPPIDIYGRVVYEQRTFFGRVFHSIGNWFR